jgi:sulfate permease, SulP family
MAQPGAGRAAWSWLGHYIPLLRWAPVYDWRRRLLGDLVAGVTVTAVAAPEAVSYAAIAGLPPAQGLYTGFLGPLAYAVAGSSPQLIVGPTAIMCILTNNAIPAEWAGGAVEPKGAKEPTDLRVELAAMLSIAVALLQLAFAVFRLGGLVTLISTPVVAGFTSGSALLTAASQVPSLLGMPKCVGASGGSCTVAEVISYVADNPAAVNGNVTLMSAVCIGVLLALKFGPLAAAPRLPPAARPFARLASNLAPLLLVVITVPIVAAAGKQLEAWGLDPPKAIPAGLPPPLWPFGTAVTRAGTAADYAGLFAAAVPLAVIGYMGAVTISKTAARQNGPYPIDDSQELWAQVAANAACGIGRGLPVTGSFSRTAVNAASGVASLLTAGFMALALETITGTLSLVPSVVRSAIVVVAIAKMVELHLLPKLWRVDRRDCAVFAVTVAVTALYSAAIGLATGVVFQWLVALTRSALAPTPVRVYGWVRGLGGGAGGAAAPVAAAGKPGPGDAPSARLAAAGFLWREVRPEAGVAAGSLNAASGRRPAAEAAPASAAPGGAAVLTFGPDLQFGSAARLRAHIDEAVAVYAPAAVVIDAAGVGAVDSTGAAALVDAARDAAAGAGAGRPRVSVIVCGLPRDALAVVIQAAGGCSPAVAGADADRIVAAGPLLLARTHAAALDAAADAAAAASLAAGGAADSGAADGPADAPLLAGDGKRAAGSGIDGVPLSSRVAAQQAARRRRVPLAVDAGDGGDGDGGGGGSGGGGGGVDDGWDDAVSGGERGKGAGVVARVAAEVVTAAAAARAALDSSAPLLALAPPPDAPRAAGREGWLL